MDVYAEYNSRQPIWHFTTFFEHPNWHSQLENTGSSQNEQNAKLALRRSQINGLDQLLEGTLQM